MKNYFWDDDNVRYELAQSNNGTAYNWLFVPGGPGADSSYFMSLLQDLKLPGNTWLIDFPANGSNAINGHLDYDFDRWLDIFPSVISKFQNAVYVGHSFGGMLPLLYPQLENLLKGFVILNAAPSLWLEEAALLAVQKGLPILLEPVNEFARNPSPETFEQALIACMPYYFPKQTLEIGKALLKDLPLNYRAAVWWLNKVMTINYSAQWVPEQVPTLIIGGTEDCICPSSLFEKDTRFNRKNIMWKNIVDAGHMPWVEKPLEVKKAFDDLISHL